MNSLPVRLSPEAEQDILDIEEYVSERECSEAADALVERLHARIATLRNLPLRGNVPPELLVFGSQEYREVHEVPWRIVYEVEETQVLVLAVLGSRRNVRDLLEERLLRP